MGALAVTMILNKEFSVTRERGRRTEQLAQQPRPSRCHEFYKNTPSFGMLVLLGLNFNDELQLSKQSRVILTRSCWDMKVPLKGFVRKRHI